VFELRYERYEVNGKVYSEMKRISLDAGCNLNRLESMFSGGAKGEPVQIAVGLAKRKGAGATKNEDHGWLGLWGPTNDDPVNGALGTGIVFPRGIPRLTEEDSAQYLLVGEGAVGEPFVYYAGAGWTRSGDFPSEADWNRYLDDFAVRIAAPIRVVVGVAEK
jgi:hypothetical protein